MNVSAMQEANNELLLLFLLIKFMFVTDVEAHGEKTWNYVH